MIGGIKAGVCVKEKEITEGKASSSPTPVHHAKPTHKQTNDSLAFCLSDMRKRFLIRRLMAACSAFPFRDSLSVTREEFKRIGSALLPEEEAGNKAIQITLFRADDPPHALCLTV